jgi:uncharacterized protein (TIGR04255 family)
MRFNPVLVSAPFLPALQDAFRAVGFPDYAATTVQAFDFSAGQDGMEVRQDEVTRHVFRNKAQTAAILLDPAAMTYELTDYPVFGEFSAMFLRALELVDHHRTIEYCDRLGMRMLDAVQPRAGEHLEQYLVPQALGLAGIVGASFEHHQTLTESLFQHDTRTLVVRAVRVPRGIAVPPDLAPFRLKLEERFIAHQGETVMLDCDSARSERMDFSRDETNAELVRLKSALSNSFKALVTDHARTVWA